MSDSASRSPEASFAELQQLVRHLGEELAAFRARALNAEARVRALTQRVGQGEVDNSERVAELERENSELRQRLATAGDQARQMLDRLRFLRQQQDGGEA